MHANRIFKAAVVLLFAGALQSGAAFSAPSALVTKNPGESDAAFVARITKHDVTTVFDGPAQLGNTSALIKGAQTLVAFTNVPDPDPTDPDTDEIYMNVFVKQSGLSYARIDSMKVCEVEGSAASMRSFFYTQLKGSSEPVVGVICGWDEGHRYAECQLNDEVRFFEVDRSAINAVPMDKFDKIFYKQSKDCTVSKFNTVEDVKKLLRASH
jgi:hypothetical protein